MRWGDIRVIARIRVREDAATGMFNVTLSSAIKANKNHSGGILPRTLASGMTLLLGVSPR
jgi:hypothetical protein